MPLTRRKLIPCPLVLLQVYNTERAIWTTERSTLTYIHHTLEEEMEAIARELIDYSPNHPEMLVPSS
jgi:hypothetical protein